MTLIDRLSKLEGPNRRLDHEMHILFFVPDDKKNTVEWNHFGSYSWSPSPDHFMTDKVPAYTASVDAAIALAERVLPSDFIDIEVNQRRHMDVLSGRAEICAPNFEAEVRAVTPAIALCIAILRAKEASRD